MKTKKRSALFCCFFFFIPLLFHPHYQALYRKENEFLPPFNNIWNENDEEEKKNNREETFNVFAGLRTFVGRKKVKGKNSLLYHK